VSGYALRENGQSEGFAASLGLNLRKHFFIRDPFSIYIDGGMGMIRADGQFPDGGTNTNFTLQGGLGATYRLSDSLHLVGGVRWFHISNARRHGEDGNMSTDGPAVYAGLMWTW
jgi:opacity protein-like surface antigen